MFTSGIQKAHSKTHFILIIEIIVQNTTRNTTTNIIDYASQHNLITRIRITFLLPFHNDRYNKYIYCFKKTFIRFI